MDSGTSEAIGQSELPVSTADLALAMDAKRSDRSRDPAQTSTATLLAEAESDDFRTRWDQIQTGFVDEPRRAVEDADALVASAMRRLAETFASERSELERAWDRGGDVSTEDLRIALQRYRSFFDRLLAI